MSDADYYAEHPTPRMLAAEARRESRLLVDDLFDRSSFGTPGAKAIAKRGAIYLGKLPPESWTEEDERLANEHMAELEAEMTAMNRRRKRT